MISNMCSFLQLPRAFTGWRKCIHITIFLFLLGNDLADFVSDWLFFADVVIADKGLVYGPPDPAAVWCLLLFSIIGTITFIFECANLWWESFRNNPWIDSDWLSAIVIWIEDVPQVLISLHLALCREEPISIFQLLKAAVVLIGVVIRVLVTSVKYCNKDAVKSHHHVKIKIVIMLGIIIEAMAAAVIFFLTQTERNNSGDVAFRVPSTVIEDTYNDQRYFTNVSLFMYSAALMGAAYLDPNTNDSVVNWVRLMHLSKIRDQDTAYFKIEYGPSTASNLTLAISERKQDKSNWILTECYNISTSTGQITELSNTTCSGAVFTNPTIIFIALLYEKPGSVFKKKVFGDIHINIKKNESGTCTSVDEYAGNVDNINTNHNIPFIFHYYRTNETIDYDDVNHLLKRAGTPRFYLNENSDMIDVGVVWKTGWMECACNGNIAPILDPDLALTCS